VPGKSIEVFFMVMSVGQDIGSYHIIAEVSHGESALIYQAVHRILTSHVVAIKLLYTARLHAQDEQEDFFREARILAELQHPHILPLIDVNIYEGLPYIITEFATHGSLRNRLNHQATSPLPSSEALSILRQVGEALHFAHQHNIVHCDVKPENILFTARNEAVMADFDIARVLNRANSAVHSPGGTSAYMAPEQFQGKVRKESDQYSLGCIAYELLTGKRPFRGEDRATMMHAHLYEKPLAPTQVRSGLPIQVDEVILRVMAKKYTDRYGDILSFIDALSAASDIGGSRLRSPLVLKGAVVGSVKDPEIYYEKTELNPPEAEMTGTGYTRVNASKRHTTEAIEDIKAVTPKRVRATPVYTEASPNAVSKKKAEPIVEKKPVKRSASTDDPKRRVGAAFITPWSETVAAEVPLPAKKAESKHTATVTKKTTVEEKQAEASQKKTATRKASVAKKSDDTLAKPPVVKKRAAPVEKEGVTGGEHVVRKTKKPSSEVKN
jgi:serine/threonine protein kinase